MSWLWTKTDFVPFGAAHLAALALTAVMAATMARWGRVLRGQPQQLWLSRGLALLILTLQGGLQARCMTPANFDWESSLPLQLCDVAWMVAIFALWTYRTWAFGVVYYWGLTTTLLAMITPDLELGFPNVDFLMFFFGHGMVVVAAVYLRWGVGLCPTWRLFGRTAALTIAYVAATYLVNSLLGVNYVYLNRSADPGTMLDYFGPYPMHIVVGALIALTGWAALTWPWTRRSASEVSSG